MIREFVEKLEEWNKIILVSHVQPDADAYSSVLAMSSAFLALGKETRVVNENGILSSYLFIPGIDQVLDSLPTDFDYDLICVCDCGDKKRVGDRFKSIFDKGVPVVNIDHHISNTMFGDYNIVDASKSSTAELVSNVVKEIGIDISVDIANQILVGVIDDTGSFRYRNTSSETLRLAAELVDIGADLAGISQELYGKRSVAAVQLEAAVMGQIEFLYDNQVSKICVTKEILNRCKARKSDCEGLVESARDIDGILVAIFIYEGTDYWKVSLRSVNDQYNVAPIAQFFGGGGHKQAAGFRFRGTRSALEEVLIEKVGALVS